MAPAAAEVAAEAPPAGAASTARTTRRRQVSSSALDDDRLRPDPKIEWQLARHCLMSADIHTTLALCSQWRRHQQLLLLR